MAPRRDAEAVQRRAFPLSPAVPGDYRRLDACAQVQWRTMQASKQPELALWIDEGT